MNFSVVLLAVALLVGAEQSPTVTTISGSELRAASAALRRFEGDKLGDVLQYSVTVRRDRDEFAVSFSPRSRNSMTFGDPASPHGKSVTFFVSTTDFVVLRRRFLR